MYAKGHRQALLGADVQCMRLLFSMKIFLFVGTNGLETCFFVLFCFVVVVGGGDQFSKWKHELANCLPNQEYFNLH